MKIISVKFLNLNSLKGVHEIRFDQPPFTESGLFAITGPTGAGKTTILDAITVALYARVHRHNKAVEEVMSRHTAECYSEVEFEVKEKVYRAKWSLRRSRGKADGAIQPEKMELAEADTGTILGGHTPTLIKQAIVDLCGLDYNQFLRSVILSQGDFTRFLRADDNERSELLEKITDTGIYSDISRFVFDRQRAEKERLELLNAKLDNTEVLSPEQRQAYEESLAELREKEAEFKKELGTLNGRVNWLSQLRKLEEKRENTSLDLKEKKQIYDENKLLFNRLSRHKEAVVFRPALAAIKAVKDQMERVSLEKQQQEEAVPEYTREADESHSRLGWADEVLGKAQRELDAMLPVFEKVILLDSEILNLKRQTESFRLRADDTAKAIDHLVVQKRNKTAEMERLAVEIKGLESWLDEHASDKELVKLLPLFRESVTNLKEINSSVASDNEQVVTCRNQEKEEQAKLADNIRQILDYQTEIGKKEELLRSLQNKVTESDKNADLQTLESLQNSLPELIGICGHQYRLAISFQKNKENEKSLTDSITELKSSMQSQRDQLALLEKERELAERQLADLRLLAEVQQRIANYEADRQYLVHGKPCPLCGSQQHPFVEGRYENNLSEVALKRNEQEKYLSQLLKESESKHLEINTIKVTINQKQIELNKQQADQEIIKEEFVYQNSLLPAPLDIESTSIIQAVIAKKKQELENVLTQIQAIRLAQQQINDTNSALSRLRESLIEREGRSASITERIKAYEERLMRLSSMIISNKEKASAIISNINSILVVYGLEFDCKRIDEIEEALSARSGKYVLATSRLQDLQVKRASLKTDMFKTEESLSEKRNEQIKHEEAWIQEKEKFLNKKSERVALFGGADAAKERVRLNAALKQKQESYEDARHDQRQKSERLTLTLSKIDQYKGDLENLNDRAEQLSNDLAGRLQEKGILSIESLRLLFLSPEEEQRIDMLERELAAGIAALEKVLADTEAEITVEAERKLTTETPEALQLLIEQAERVILDLNREIGKLTQIMEEDARLRTRFEEIMSEIDIQKREFERWAKLSSLIGSADGKKFSRFAQGLTLSRLTDLANRHLSKLTDRYQILKSDKRDLELLIIDGYQADAVRPMATLSGGESFLVSLALALGLSDLASRKVQINSLFIDEGFGTLDADTLDIAVSALENLQARGKMIGIISHVDALKERIGTQIQVSKHTGGASRINVVSYTTAFEL